MARLSGGAMSGGPASEPALDPARPAVIGGVGGSGTRVVTEMLMGLGYFMGDRNNSAHDNGWFRFLLKRPEWYMRTAEADPARVRLGLDVFTWIMTGVGPRPPGAWPFILEAVREQRWRGVKRLRRLLLRRPDRSGAVGWGWKEPNTHLYLEHLTERYPGLKYIHTIRHGMDMAFSRTRGQLYQWAPFFGLTVPDAEAEIPAVFLEFWIRANRRALALGETLGPDRFHLLNFDRMCAAPREEAAALARFLGLAATDGQIERIAALCQSPRSIGRYREQDLGIFSPAQIAAVHDLGFDVEQ